VFCPLSVPSQQNTPFGSVHSNRGSVVVENSTEADTVPSHHVSLIQSKVHQLIKALSMQKSYKNNFYKKKTALQHKSAIILNIKHLNIKPFHFRK
jgi:hypothetical protein